jgi:hypothetical protein
MSNTLVQPSVDKKVVDNSVQESFIIFAAARLLFPVLTTLDTNYLVTTTLHQVRESFPIIVS